MASTASRLAFGRLGFSGLAPQRLRVQMRPMENRFMTPRFYAKGMSSTAYLGRLMSKRLGTSSRTPHHCTSGFLVGIAVGSFLFNVQHAQAEEEESASKLLSNLNRVYTSDEVEESITGAKVPVQIHGEFNMLDPCWLMGMSVRCMMGYCGFKFARAYVFALYVDQLSLIDMKPEIEGGSSLLEVIEKKKDGELLGNLAMRLTLVRDIDGPHMAKGFERSFGKRLEVLINNPDISNDDVVKSRQELQKLARYFRTLENTMKEGVSFTFVWKRNGDMEFYQDTQLVEIFDSKLFIQSIFDTYIGSNPVSKSGKATIIDRARKVLSGIDPYHEINGQ